MISKISNRLLGMASIWMACEARRSKTRHGDGGVVIAQRGALVGRASEASDGLPPLNNG